MQHPMSPSHVILKSDLVSICSLASSSHNWPPSPFRLSAPVLSFPALPRGFSSSSSLLAALQHLPSALLHPQLPHASPLQAIIAARLLATLTPMVGHPLLLGSRPVLQPPRGSSPTWPTTPPPSLAAPQASPPQQHSGPSN
ncbi:hypothetical protein GOP47_0026960 [Adiantum capillus-veneris]|nr:hypothetical protein GOP47_0026960 [Adiantum capillus-veneris]